MTYHPIDKPTEPGWYWVCESGALWELVRVVRVPTCELEMIQVSNGGLIVRTSIGPSRGQRGPFGPLQWYGPKIEPPPAPEKSNGKICREEPECPPPS